MIVNPKGNKNGSFGVSRGGSHKDNDPKKMLVRFPMPKVFKHYILGFRIILIGETSCGNQ